ncbi:MAG: class I SAM-dependent methyltransferase [Candidatus Kapabacteria bacterium]|nr:class I SAM-dependent methyltransferase [Candidatus Kapabacteria bacterium]
MDHRQHFYNRYTSVQSRFSSLEDARARVAVEQRGLENSIGAFLPQGKTAKILDLGCGYGAFLLYMRDLGYSNLRGVDRSDEQVRLANSLGLTCVENGDLFSAIATESAVNLVTMFDVIEHLTRSEAIQALTSIHTILETGGTLILRTPNIDALHGTALSFGDLTHELHLNKGSVLELFASLPYSSVEILPVLPTGGGFFASVVRAIVSPVFTFINRCSYVVNGISWSATIKTPNMIIVARR